MWEVDPDSVSKNPEDGTERCTAVNSETGETQEFAHEEAWADAASFCYWGNMSSEQLHEHQKPYGIDWQHEQAQRRGEISEDEPVRYPF